MACVIDKSSRGAKLERAFEELPKGLVVNGVQPGAKTAQDGTWPISRELYLFTSGQPQGDAKKLVDYTLSAEGQQFVSKSGFVPLK